jgi:hypothetical protein
LPILGADEPLLLPRVRTIKHLLNNDYINSWDGKLQPFNAKAVVRCTIAEITGCRGRRKKGKSFLDTGFRRAGRNNQRPRRCP